MISPGLVIWTAITAKTNSNMDPRHAPSQLVIDLAALRENYRILDKQSGNARVSAVVKSNAYGLGLAKIVKCLFSEGCQTFLTAHLDEAITVRQAAPEAEVISLNGLLQGEEELYRAYEILPTLNDPGQLERWHIYNREQEAHLPAALHFDTGMSRLGFAPKEYEALAEDTAPLRDFDCRYLFSHLACAEQADHPMNHQSNGMSLPD